jgi:hypothetical protein
LQPSRAINCVKALRALFSLFFTGRLTTLLFICSLSATEIPGQSPEEKVHARYINAPRTRIDLFDNKCNLKRRWKFRTSKRAFGGERFSYRLGEIAFIEIEREIA